MSTHKAKKGRKTITLEQIQHIATQHLNSLGMFFPVVAEEMADGKGGKSTYLSLDRESTHLTGSPAVKLERTNSLYIQGKAEMLLHELHAEIAKEYPAQIRAAVEAVRAHDRAALLHALETAYQLGCELHHLQGAQGSLPRMGSDAREVLEQVTEADFYRLCAPEELYACRRLDYVYSKHIGATVN